ncbi:MAG: ABC transporter permease [Acidobacteriota bacterium]|nr:ABC transporter permease [Acidobacteriota bacterium]
MKNTLVITRRELTEKRFVVLTAIAFAVLALIVPFVPGVHSGERRNAIAVASLIFATGFTGGLAAILGASIIGKELSDGRLSFYFSKPVSAASIWFGKLIAATLLIVVSFTIIVSPAFFAGITGVIRTWTSLGDSLPTVRIILAGAAVLFLVGHVIGTFVRSRSAWLVFDFVAATVCGIAIWMIGRSLLLGYAIELTRRLWVILAVFAALAILAGGFWQVARGRTDRKRSHIELSRFLWMALGCALLVLTGYTVWVTSISFSALIPESLDQSNKGTWAVISGVGNHRGDYRASFLYNVRDGRAQRIPFALGPWTTTEFSGDERTVAWVSRATLASAPTELYLAKLDSPNPQMIATGIPFSGNYCLSDDGSRAAVSEFGNLITVYDLASHTSLGSARVPNARWITPLFVSNDVVRIFDHSNQATRVYEYDVAKKVFRQTGEAPAEFWRFTADKTRAIAYWKRPDITIYDARTGRLLTTIPIKAASAKFLRDGRVAAIDDRNVLHVFTAGGAPIRSIALPAETVSPMWEIGGGLIVVVVKMRQTDLVIDIDRGAIVRTETGLLPSYHGQGPLLLCSNKEHELVVWNPATGEKRIVLKRS